MLKRFHNWLLNWKPIHLCWLFRKFGWPIPKYLIGAGLNIYLDQTGWVIMDDDNADPDDCTPDTPGVTRTGQAKETNFMVRVQVLNTGDDPTPSSPWELYYNDSDTTAGAIQVGTPLDGTTQVDSNAGVPSSATVDDKTVINDLEPGYTWQNGEYEETDAETDSKHSLLADYFTEFQFCVQFTSLAQDDTTYYFFLMRSDDVLESYSGGSAKVSTPVAAGGPKGPLGHPLNGPFRGPIS